jgi:hypothetical protein
VAIGGRKKNTQAAVLAGLKIDRVTAFRYARAVSVKKLLDSADRVKLGKQPALTESEIDQLIDAGIRRPDALTSARYLEIREKRLAAKRSAGETLEDDGFSDARVMRDFMVKHPDGVLAAMLIYRSGWGDMGHPANFPLLHDVYHLAQQHPLGQTIFDHCAANLSDTMKECLRERLSDPAWQLEGRQKIWREIDRDPPGPCPRAAA